MASFVSAHSSPTTKIIPHGLLTARVMHRRLRPKVNAFQYRVYYLCAPLRQLTAFRSSLLRWSGFGLFSLNAHDHADGENWEGWIKRILVEHGLNQAAEGEVTLITMPRILGYGFNPVSFWCCRDARGQLRAVLAEVHNTFGQRHNYLCAPEDGGVIDGQRWLEARKTFHVSPFLALEGKYRFRFDIREDKIGIWIDHHDEQGTMLLTAVTGERCSLSTASLWRCFWRYPLLTWRVIALIHYQAIKILAKKIRYIPLPPLPPDTVTRGGDSIQR